jgi:hypothetical protein
MASAPVAADVRTTDGLVVYLGVIPGAMIQGHAEDPLHDAVPTGPHAYHVTVALFDAATGARVEDAQVDAEVTPLGLSPERRALEPMEIANTVTYGNFFTMRIRGPYRIHVSILRPGAERPATAEFTYEHTAR